MCPSYSCAIKALGSIAELSVDFAVRVVEEDIIPVAAQSLRDLTNFEVQKVAAHTLFVLADRVEGVREECRNTLGKEIYECLMVCLGVSFLCLSFIYLYLY